MDEEYGYDGWMGSTDGEVVGMAWEGSGGERRGVEGQQGKGGEGRGREAEEGEGRGLEGKAAEGLSSDFERKGRG